MGYKIYEGVKKKGKFEIEYCSIVTGIFVVMTVLKSDKKLLYNRRNSY